MLAATFRTLVRTLVQSTSRPGDVLARANRLMFEQLSGVDMFVTAQVAVLDPLKRQLTVANAGHCPLLLFHAKGADPEEIAPEGMPLGIVPDALYVETFVALEPGACVLLYTDGVTESLNREGHSFSVHRLQKWMRRHAGIGLSASQLKDHLLAELATFERNTTTGDDQTFVLLASSAGALPAQEVAEGRRALQPLPLSPNVNLNNAEAANATPERAQVETSDLPPVILHETPPAAATPILPKADPLAA